MHREHKCISSRPWMLLCLGWAAVSAPGQAWPPPTGFALEDLVRASAGRLSVYARNLDTGAEISLNGDVSQPLGDARRLLVAGALLSELRSRGMGTNGASAPEATAHALLFKMLRTRDGKAEDAIVKDLGSHRILRWIQDLGIAGLGPVTYREDEARRVAVLRDPRFSAVPPETLTRWWNEEEPSGLVPRWFQEDPRLAQDHRTRMAQAFRTWHASRANHARPRALVALLERVMRGTLGHREDCKVLMRCLLGTTEMGVASDLPIRFVTSGLDGESGLSLVSLGLVETDRGAIAMSLHASDYVAQDMARELLGRIATDIVRRLAPGATPGAGVAPLPERLLRTALLIDHADAGRWQDRSFSGTSSEASRVTFRTGETPALVLGLAPEEEMIAVVAWSSPLGTIGLQRVPWEARRLATSVTSGHKLSAAGRHGVQVAIRGVLVFDHAFMVLPAK